MYSVAVILWFWRPTAEAVERWVLGSVTEHILGATRLPMLIVRPKEQHTQTATASMQIEAR